MSNVNLIDLFISYSPTATARLFCATLKSQLNSIHGFQFADNCLVFLLLLLSRLVSSTFSQSLIVWHFSGAPAKMGNSESATTKTRKGFASWNLSCPTLSAPSSPEAETPSPSVTTARSVCLLFSFSFAPFQGSLES